MPVHRARAPAGAFTLVELLVVLALIGVLAGLLLPALSRARARAGGVVCLHQVRQLTLAWNLYATDAQDRLVYNLGLDRRQPRRTLNPDLNWVNNVMTWELDPGNTNAAFINVSPLGPYLGHSRGVFRCPSDRVLSEVQREAGWRHRVRSVSMNAMVGDAGPNVRGAENVLNPGYQQFLTLAAIPSPDHIFVLLDEHPDSIGDGYFLNRSDDAEWLHLPASYHNGAGDLAFADGHAEGHRWRFALTQPPNRPDVAALPLPVPSAQADDLAWIIDRTSVEVQ